MTIEVERDISMQLARVIGNVVATRKDENLAGITLLLVQPLTPDARPPGRPLVAVDPSAPASARKCSSSAARKRAFRSIRLSRRSTPASSASSITGTSDELQIAISMRIRC